VYGGLRDVIVSVNPVLSACHSNGRLEINAAVPCCADVVSLMKTPASLLLLRYLAAVGMLLQSCGVLKYAYAQQQGPCSSVEEHTVISCLLLPLTGNAQQQHYAVLP
jgi:hypothetical protein